MAEPDSCAGYKAAGVIFFTRDGGGPVQRVLLALEERKVSVKQLGLATPPAKGNAGKVNTDVVVFPQGRREKKDDGDPIETAMREYHEETGNFGALTEHLLRFYEDDAESRPSPESASKQQASVAAAESFVMYFGLARMVVVFCEVPPAAYARSLRPLSRADFAAGNPAGARTEPKSSRAPAGSDDGAPSKKRQKKEAQHGSSYRVGRENHLTPVWVSADELRRAVTASLECDPGSQRIEVSVCPRPSVDGTGRIGVSGGEATGPGERRAVPFFPLNLSVFRQREARAWLGLPAAEARAGTPEPAAAAAPDRG